MVKTIRHIVLFLFVFCLQINVLNAQQFSEYEVKGAFICNFAKFAEWPASSYTSDTSAIEIAIVGNDPFGDVIDRIAKNAGVGQRKVIVKRYNSPEDAKKSHIVFFGGLTENSPIEILLRPLANKPVLTISEVDGFCEHGGMINFPGTPIKYGFEINSKSVKSAGLAVSPKLLHLAVLVE